MLVENKVHPSDEQMEGFLEPGQEGPIYMVNLLKFRELPAYEDGRECDLTGAQAYAIYGRAVAKLVHDLGGEMVFAGTVSRLMLGEVEDLWDQVAIVMYPSREAMLGMVMSDAYRDISVHRDAGLQGQLNIETSKAMASAVSA
ncbi:MAG: DUF1330 domain-containing protein [Halioglobus sp.]